MGKLIIDNDEGDETVSVDYETLDPGTVTSLAIGGDDDALAYLLKQFEAENPVSTELKMGRFTDREWRQHG